MDKYVNAERVKEKCAESCKYVRVGNEEYLSVGDVCRIVDEMPSADVAEVVRCKDCRHWKFEECTKVRLYHNTEFGVGRVAVTYPTQENDFCSRAERKETE